jgi:hypothetical protein
MLFCHGCGHFKQIFERKNCLLRAVVKMIFCHGWGQFLKGKFFFAV